MVTVEALTIFYLKGFMMNDLHNVMAYLLVVYDAEHYEKTKENKIIGYKLCLGRYAEEPSEGSKAMREHGIEFHEFVTIFSTKVTKKKAKELQEQGIKVTAGYHGKP